MLDNNSEDQDPFNVTRNDLVNAIAILNKAKALSIRSLSALNGEELSSEDVLPGVHETAYFLNTIEDALYTVERMQVLSVERGETLRPQIEEKVN